MSPKETSNAPAGVDRRLDPRYDTRIEATVDDPKYGKLFFTTTEFSRTGALLLPRDKKLPMPAIGSVVNLVLHWPLETQMPPVRLEAKVIHQRDEGIGVRFELKI